MDTLTNRTSFANKGTVKKEWWVVDAEGKALGRLATNIARVLRGKHKADFSPHVDCGDCVIVLNSNKVHLSGDKWTAKKYVSYSGYQSGQKVVNAKLLNQKKPLELVEKAVRGMLPKNRLGRQILKNLFVYENDEHPHQAQQPQPLELKF